MANAEEIEISLKYSKQFLAPANNATFLFALGTYALPMRLASC